MARYFNPPPGWPKPEEGWTPPPGWKPNPEWPDAPEGWNFFIERNDEDETGSSLFGGSALSTGSTLFETSDTTTDSYGSVSPSGKSQIPGAPDGPDLTAHTGEAGSSSAPPSSPAASATYNQGPGGTTAPSGPTGLSGQGGSGVDPGTVQASPPQTERKGSSGISTLLVGLVALIGGGVATYVSYSNTPPGGEYQVYVAPMLVGAVAIVMGVIRMLRARSAARADQPGGAPGYSGPGTPLASGGSQGDTSTVSTQNPTDPKNYRPN